MAKDERSEIRKSIEKSQADWRASQGLPAASKEKVDPPKPADAPYVDLPTGERSHPRT